MFYFLKWQAFLKWLKSSRKPKNLQHAPYDPTKLTADQYYEKLEEINQPVISVAPGGTLIYTDILHRGIVRGVMTMDRKTKKEYNINQAEEVLQFSAKAIIRND